MRKTFIVEMDEQLASTLKNSGQMKIISEADQPLEKDGVKELRASGYSVYVSRMPTKDGTLYEIEKDGKEVDIVKYFDGKYHMKLKPNLAGKVSNDKSWDTLAAAVKASGV